MSVCQDQTSFNQAFNKAVKYVDKKNQPLPMAKMLTGLLVLVFFVWALMLAMKVEGTSEQKLVHLVLAMVFSPLYVIAHYLNEMNLN
jgi:hypothetical protein